MRSVDVRHLLRRCAVVWSMFQVLMGLTGNTRFSWPLPLERGLVDAMMGI